MDSVTQHYITWGGLKGHSAAGVRHADPGSTPHERDITNTTLEQSALRLLLEHR